MANAEIEPVGDAVERVVHPRLPFVPGLWLDDRQPPPDPRVARRLPQVVRVLLRQWFEPHDPALERRCEPAFHDAGTVHS